MGQLLQHGILFDSVKVGLSQSSTFTARLGNRLSSRKRHFPGSASIERQVTLCKICLLQHIHMVCSAAEHTWSLQMSCTLWQSTPIFQARLLPFLAVKPVKCDIWEGFA